MTGEPLVSFIVPVYNVRPYVADCVRSILNQSHSNVECICVDDGSTDGSGELLDEMASGDDRLKVVHQANAGVGAARNNGLSRARGEFLAFVDSDDLMENNCLKPALAAFAEHSDLDVWMGQLVCVDEENRPLDGPQLKTALYDTVNPLEYFRTAKGKFYLFSACAKLFRSQQARDEIYRFTEGVKSGEDSTFMAKVYSGARRVIVSDVNVYRRRIRKGSLIGTGLPERVPDFIANIDDLLRFAAATHREGKLCKEAAYSAMGRVKAVLMATTAGGASRYAHALVSQRDFRRVVAGTICRHAPVGYRAFGWAMKLLPAVAVEKLMMFVWRVYRREFW
ncbi:MAG: glycosyltransferase family 2 protein [Kiritimatiellae bacterium]|nr:glycosyltransferase family 2 protein [Kiritimatiellia bacterium]